MWYLVNLNYLIYNLKRLHYIVYSYINKVPCISYHWTLWIQKQLRWESLFLQPKWQQGLRGHSGDGKIVLDNILAFRYDFDLGSTQQCCHSIAIATLLVPIHSLYLGLYEITSRTSQYRCSNAAAALLRSSAACRLARTVWQPALLRSTICIVSAMLQQNFCVLPRSESYVKSSIRTPSEV